MLESLSKTIGEVSNLEAAFDDLFPVDESNFFDLFRPRIDLHDLHPVQKLGRLQSRPGDKVV